MDDARVSLGVKSVIIPADKVPFYRIFSGIGGCGRCGRPITVVDAVEDMTHIGHVGLIDQFPFL